MSDWISVKRMLPENAIEVIVSTGWAGDYTGTFIARYESDTKSFVANCMALTKVTHWMPLPPPPENAQ